MNRAGLEQCKKCGHHFTQVSGQAYGTPSLFHEPPESAKAPATLEFQPDEERMEMGDLEITDSPIEFEQERTSSQPLDSNEDSPGEDQPRGFPAWQAELAERVQEYRQRRAHISKIKESDHKTLDLDFESATTHQKQNRPHVIEFPPSAEEPEPPAKPAAEPQPEPPSSAMGHLELTPERKDHGAASSTGKKTRSFAETGPLEIELDSSLGASSDSIGEGEDSAGMVASLATRFVAGVIDALILLSGAVIFGLIYWRTGGHFALHPLEFAVVGIITVFFIVLYFAGCTALASATPGLIWTGLEVRTFEGNPPGPAECFWRAFGYLVSMSALMLGFVWAVVDADGLTWHDRMSRTFLTFTSAGRQ